MGSIRLYVVHPVNLWNGTKSSPSAVEEGFKAEQGHTSPRDTPPRVVLDGGQIGLRPSMRAYHKAEMGTLREPPDSMDSDSRKSGGDVKYKSWYIDQVDFSPMMFPGRASLPKKVGLELRALLRLNNRDVRPSSPTIGLELSACMALATLSTVILDKPIASDLCQRSI